MKHLDKKRKIQHVDLVPTAVKEITEIFRFQYLKYTIHDSYQYHMQDLFSVFVGLILDGNLRDGFNLKPLCTALTIFNQSLRTGADNYRAIGGLMVLDAQSEEDLHDLIRHIFNAVTMLKDFVRLNIQPDVLISTLLQIMVQACEQAHSIISDCANQETLFKALLEDRTICQAAKTILRHEFKYRMPQQFRVWQQTRDNDELLSEAPSTPRNINFFKTPENILQHWVSAGIVSSEKTANPLTRSHQLLFLCYCASFAARKEELSPEYNLKQILFKMTPYLQFTQEKLGIILPNLTHLGDLEPRVIFEVLNVLNLNVHTWTQDITEDIKVRLSKAILSIKIRDDKALLQHMRNYVSGTTPQELKQNSLQYFAPYFDLIKELIPTFIPKYLITYIPEQHINLKVLLQLYPLSELLDMINTQHHALILEGNVDYNFIIMLYDMATENEQNEVLQIFKHSLYKVWIDEPSFIDNFHNAAIILQDTAWLYQCLFTYDDQALDKTIGILGVDRCYEIIRKIDDLQLHHNAVFSTPNLGKGTRELISKNPSLFGVALPIEEGKQETSGCTLHRTSSTLLTEEEQPDAIDAFTSLATFFNLRNTAEITNLSEIVEKEIKNPAKHRPHTPDPQARK
jgi:hypothetical protein